MDNPIGYAWGITGGDEEWLSIPGSHWAPPVLTDQPDDAERPYPAANILAKVERWYHSGVASGRAFRILHIHRREPT